MKESVGCISSDEDDTTVYHNILRCAMEKEDSPILLGLTAERHKEALQYMKSYLFFKVVREPATAFLKKTHDDN